MHLRPLPLACLLAAAATAAPARADNTRFEAAVPTENITLDQSIELTVTIEHDGAQALESYRPPALADFDIEHQGTSQQMQMSLINGRQSVRVAEVHEYVLRARKKGAFTIGPASARVGGQELHTRAITIHVAAPLKNAISMAAPPPAPDAVPPPESMQGTEDLVLDARVDKPRAWVGEQVTATWRLYTRTEIINYRPLTEPKHEEFWSENLLGTQYRASWQEVYVHGQKYVVAVLMKQALFPLKAGKLVITPLEVEATTLQSAFYAGASAARRSPPLTVDVRRPPAEGRLAGFEPANVGQLQITSVVDRAQVKAGEAVTWRVTLRGTGNLRNIKLHKLDKVDGFKVYEPTVKDQLDGTQGTMGGERIFTYLLMPERGGALTLPKVELPYFDPLAAAYATASAPPVTITVEGDPTKVAQAATGPATENVLALQVRPIRNLKSVRSALGERLMRGRLAAVFVATPPGAWLLVLIVDGLRRRLARETAGSKRRRARRSARRRLRVAEYHIRAQRPSAFFGECARVIYEHLEYRLGSKVESLTLSELREHLARSGFVPETAEAVVKELENCDFARFAPSASGPGEMRAALRRVRTLLGWIEKARPEKEAAA